MALPLFGQDSPFHESNFGNCGVNQVPELINLESERLIDPNWAFINSDSTIIIPVVVHIRHNYDYANVDIGDVKEAIRQLNERFSLQNSDTINIHPEFRKRMGNPNIEFRLATIDPDGNCTSGITRTTTTQSCSSITPLSYYWNPKKYLNIIFTYSGNQAFGVASYPDNESLLTLSGIVVSSRVFFTHTINRFSYNTTLAHEAGHYLGLRHIWGPTNEPAPTNGCDVDDSDTDKFVYDTPRQLKATTTYSGYGSSSGNCPSYPHFSCPNEPTGDNFNNYMDYSCCRSMFTKDQVKRMRTILTTYRSELTSQANLIATGTDDASQNQNCNLPPRASFAYDNDRDSAWVIVTDKIEFKGYYNNTTPDTWEWTFKGGTPEKSYERNPKVTFPKTGKYDIQLIVSNQYGSDTLSENLKVFILPKNDYYGEELSEDFESSTIGEEILDWSWRSGSGWSTRVIDYVGDKVAQRNGYIYCPDKLDYLHLPPMSLSGKKNLVLKFRTAFEGFTGNFGVQGSFWVFGGTSRDLREHTQLLRLVDGEMITTNNFTGINQPRDSADWKHYSVPIPAQFENVDNFYLSFITNNEGGSNFFLDDIKIEEQSVTSVQDAFRSNLQIYPNPVKDYLYTSTKGNEEKGYIIYNCFGQKISEGMFSIQLDVSHLLSGLYYIKLYNKGHQNQITQRFLKVN